MHGNKGPGSVNSFYQHGLLDPRPTEAAERANAALLGAKTLGIEVTEARLTARCGLGNIDPQHSPDGGAIAAVEAALGWPLPSAGAVLVTIRPDADAYGAMAVLGLRADGIGPDMPARTRIALIAREDRFDRGGWPGPRALPESAAEIDEVGPGEQNLGALSQNLSDPMLVPEAAVAATRRWLTSGDLPIGWRDRAAGAPAALFDAFRDGRVRLTAPDPGRIALVDGSVPGALRLGYRLAPVVIALDERKRGTPPMPCRRLIVAQWRAEHVDLVRAAAMLATEEPGWGGSPTIIGSPQGEPCRTPTARVLAVLRACATASPPQS